MKGYIRKRSNDLRVGNVKSWATMLSLRKRNLIKLEDKQQGQESDRIKTFISQAQVVKMSFLDLVNRWDLKLTNDELERLGLLEVNNMNDVDVLIDYLNHLHGKLEKRHDVFPLNSRFFFLPITLGETILILLLLIILTLV